VHDVQVLLAVDGSEHSVKAARLGLALVRADAEITILEVVSPVEGAAGFASGLEGPVVFAVDDEIDEEIIAHGAAMARDVARQVGVQSAVRVEVGDAGPIICHVAEQMGVDLVIVGSHGKGLVKRMVLGSVSTFVTHHAPCPVLVVRTDVPEHD
jgi:nucleotide-binding universal stress UspA family protein